MSESAESTKNNSLVCWCRINNPTAYRFIVRQLSYDKYIQNLTDEFEDFMEEENYQQVVNILFKN